MERGKAIEAYLALMCIRRVWWDEDGQTSTVATWMRVPAMGSEQTQAIDNTIATEHGG